MAAPPGNGDGFLTGVVEGFFGIAWSWEARRAYAGFLREQGLGAYIYAPKGDPWLRKRWAEPMPAPHYGELAALREHYRDAGVAFGIGLSPYALYREFHGEGRDRLTRKLGTLKELAPDLLCLLFDDMPGDSPELAARQAEICHFVAERSGDAQLVFCPTYYSSDPLLEAHFGPMPHGYLEELGAVLDPRVKVFWTGPKVLSEDYPASHLTEVADKLRRKPLIWDNYPVNDSRRLTPFLRLGPFQRDAEILRRHTAGHLANPMNEAWLSRIPLRSLARLYRGGEVQGGGLLDDCQALCGAELGALIAADAPLFQQRGLEALGDAERRALEDRYRPHRDDPFARDILDWLAGRYVFDPACLT